MRGFLLRFLVAGALACTVFSTRAASPADDSLLTREKPRRLLHMIGAEVRPEYIAPTNPFLKGMNEAGKKIEFASDYHLNYAFRFRPGSLADHIYGGAYQGLGIAYYALGDREELGNPVALYLLQGSRIARIGERLSLNYEWNFGISVGWVPYDPESNHYNRMMGSKLNAYINADFYFNYLLTRRIDLQAGVTLTHFSNGNTKYPNAGLNSVGLQFGMSYNFGERAWMPSRRTYRGSIAPFPRHVSYDLTLFGSWRRKGVAVGDRQFASPEAYPVAGINLAAMYNFNYKFRAGLSLDGVYDGSANVYQKDQIVPAGGGPVKLDFERPAFNKQIALGTSLRGEFVMPYFTIGIGLGVNVIHGGGDLKAYYQMLTLKIATSHSTYINIGYCVKDFQNPNYLMLGIGFRFHNKYPKFTE